MFCGCQEVTTFLSLPRCRGQGTCFGELQSSLFFHRTPPTATSPGRKPEALVIKTPCARTGLKRAKQMPGTGRARCLIEAFLLQARERVGTCCWRDIALSDRFEDWGGAEGEEKRPVKCVYVWEEQRRAEERAPEMCQRSLVPPGPEHQPGTTSGGGSGGCGAVFKAGRGKLEQRKTKKKTSQET